MGKIKTHKATAKRFSLTGSGKVRMNRANRRHNFRPMTPKRRRQLREKAILSPADSAVIKKLIPYG